LFRFFVLDSGEIVLYYYGDTAEGAMNIRVDPSLSVPVFQQIMDEVKSAIARGACAPGETIPSVRQMASQALINPNTVARAYRELEREGIVTTRRGLGVFVAESAEELCRNGRRGDIRKKLENITAEARRAGMSGEELRQEVDRALSAEYARAKTREK
jgi:GntR family transcriptional regulator